MHNICIVYFFIFLGYKPKNQKEKKTTFDYEKNVFITNFALKLKSQSTVIVG